MTRFLLTALLLLPLPLLAQEGMEPTSTLSVTGDTDCTTDGGAKPAYAELDSDAGSCEPTTCAGSSRSDYDVTVAFDTPSANPTTVTDDQIAYLYGKECPGADGTDPDIQFIVKCNGTTVHTSATKTVGAFACPGASTELKENWTFNTTDCASDGSDVELLVDCLPSGGSPGSRRSCSLCRAYWNATVSSATRSVIITDAGVPYEGGPVTEIVRGIGVKAVERKADARLARRLRNTPEGENLVAWLLGDPLPRWSRLLETTEINEWDGSQVTAVRQHSF